MRVITVPMDGTETATVVIMSGVGSRYESDKESGLSHFIEHMLFKGTEKRPTALSISEELDSIGGEYNAFTSKDRTGYYAKVDAKHIELALDIVSDMYLNSKLDWEEIEREKGAILQELNMYRDDPRRYVGDLFEELLYPNPLGRQIVGNKKTIRLFKRKHFLNYMNRFYVANNTVICVAGKFNEDKILEKIGNYFSEMRNSEKPGFEKNFDNQMKPSLRLAYKKTDQTHLMVGVRGYGDNHKDRFALSLLSVILGGNMSSRLFIEVRERRGLAYYVGTGTEMYNECGYFAAQAGVAHKNLKLTIEVILNEFKKLTKEKVSPKELQKAKDFVKSRSVMHMESSDELAMFYIDQEVTRNKIMTLEEKFRAIDKVRESDIMRVAKDIFKEKNINLAVIGPHKNKEDIRSLLKF